MERPGRNDLCPCGSGRKYKRCCLPREAERVEFAVELETAALPLLTRLARFAESAAQAGLESIAREEFPFWNGRIDKARGARVVDFLMFEYRPRHFGRRTVEQFAIEASPGLDSSTQAMLTHWVDAPRRLVQTGEWSGGFTACVDLLDENAPAFDVFDVQAEWKPAERSAAAVRPLKVGRFFICTGHPLDFAGRSAADVADAMRRRHLDYVRTQRIAGISDFLKADPKALDEEAARPPATSTIVLPGA
ncbi:MAG TPA: SEC-C domain-containing protein [Candidatus Eremiobacteraceae bacterium]|nr:SEC-C domain-containing protein [Candidatus Eremiobacteraceae bacterium]